MSDKDTSVAEGARGAAEADKEARDARKEAREDEEQPQRFAKKYTMHQEGVIKFSVDPEGAVVEIPDSAGFYGISANGKIRFSVAKGSVIMYSGWLNYGCQELDLVEIWNDSAPTMILVENMDDKSLEASVWAWG